MLAPFNSGRLGKLWLACFLSLFLPLAGFAKTNVAANVTSAAVQTAINAAVDGDTVLIPAGAASWTSGVSVGKAIQIFGAGENLTVITDATTSNGSLFDIDRITNKFVRLSGMTLIGGSGSYCLIGLGGHGVGSGVRFFRVDHITMKNLQKRGFQTGGDLSGVIDHCRLIAPGNATGVSVDGDDDGSTKPIAWSKPFSFGTTNGVVIEDCVFDWQTTIANGAIDCYAGAIWTMRHCVLTNGNIGGHGVDSSGTYRSPLGMEVYCNTNYGSASFSKTYFNFRGGTLLCYSNVIYARNPSDHPEVFISLYRASGTNIYGGTTPCCNPWGPISGTNKWDGNTDQYGYPALDQMGRVGPTTYGATKTTQVLMPMYAWSNTAYIGSSSTPIDSSTFAIQADDPNVGPYSYIPSMSRFYQQGRDYYNYTRMPNYVPLQYPHPLVLAGSQVTTNTSNNQPPTAIASADKTEGLAPLTVAFSSNGSVDPEGAPLSYNWSFGDGGTSTSASPSYRFQSPGLYAVTLAVSDGVNTTISTPLNITVGSTQAASGLSFAASSGLISDPFQTNSTGELYQTITTGILDGGRAVYPFTISDPGDYIISAIVYAPNAGGNSFYINIDAEPTDPLMIWDLVPNSGFTSQLVSWRGNGDDGADQFTPMLFRLTTGTHQLILRGREAGTSVRFFSFLRKPAPPQGIRLSESP